MKRPKYYFQYDDSEMCYDEDYFQSIMLDENMKEMEVLEAVPERIPGVFWCQMHCFSSDDSASTCGKFNCNQYEPRNKKNGRCIHHCIDLFTHGDKITLKRKELTSAQE